MYKYYEAARDERGLKDYDVCKRTGIPASTISDWKNGRIKTLKPDKLALIAAVLDVSVDYLATGRRTPTEPLSAQERELLRLYRELNATGQTEALRAIKNLSLAPAYTDKKGSSSDSAEVS